MGNELITRDQLQSDLETLYNNKIAPYLNGATHTGFTPIGTVIDFLGTTAPSHYLKCDGNSYNIADYSDLANYFETVYGSKNYFGGDGVITFAVPTISGSGDTIKCICAINNYIDSGLGGYSVAVTNPQDKQGLVYNAIAHQWVNDAGELDLLSDVEITSPTDGQSLIFDATAQKWINDAGGNGAVTVLSRTLSAGNDSVTFTGLPTSGDYLVDFFTSNGINYDDIEINSALGEVILSYETQSTSITVYCRIEEVR